MSRSKVGGVDGRRKSALAYLEKKLTEWNSHNDDFVGKNPKKANTRSHEAETARLEKEINNLKVKLKLI